jgi:hypothetical protein
MKPLMQIPNAIALARYAASSPGRIALALLTTLTLFCGHARAQISVVDPINVTQWTATRSLTPTNMIYGSVSVSPGANCLVVVAGDRNVLDTPTSLVLSNTLTTTTYAMPGVACAPSSTDRNAGVYYLYNPPTNTTAGTLVILGTTTPSSGSYYGAYAFYTLAGVDTTVSSPATNAINSVQAGGNTTTLSTTVAGCPNNGWAALAANWSPSASLPVNFTGTGSGTPTTVNTYTSQYELGLGYSANVSAGSDIFTATFTGSANKCALAVAVFQPAAPSTDATAVNFSAVTNNQMTVGWTSGGGTSRIVVANTVPITGTPVNGTSYTANATYGSGNQLSDGSYVVYNGSGNSFTASGLAPGTVYYYEVFEYNSPGDAPAYYTTGTPGSGSQTTLANEPTTQASGVNITGVSVTGMTINWTPGNGAGDIVVVKVNSGLSSNPVSGITYTASTTLGNGSAIGGGAVVFDGNGSSVTISGLSGGVTYNVAVYELNGSGGAQNYLTPAATGSGATQLAPPTVNSTSVNFSSLQTSQMTLGWTSGNGANRIVLAKAGSAPTGTPVNGITYAANAAYGTADTMLTDGFVVYNGSGNSFTVTGLSPNTVYYYEIFEFNGSGAATVYYTSGTPGNGSRTTLQTAPTAQAFSVNFSGVSATGMTIHWTRGNGANDIVVVKAGSAVSSDPVDGTAYIASTTLGVGSAIGGGNVVFDGSGSAVTISGLSVSTTYYVSVYELNGSGGAQNYLTPAATGIQASTPAEYKSNGTGGGNWNVASTWQESVNGGSTWGAATGTPTSADGTIEILANDAVTITANLSIDQVTVDNAGELLVTNGVVTVASSPGLDIQGTLMITTNDVTADTITLADNATVVVEADGVIQSQYGLTADPFNYGTGSAITNYGLFQMQKANGTVSTCIWADGSTLEVSPIADCGNAVACNGLGQSFYNVNFNFSNQGDNNVHASTTATPTIRGDLTVISTGPRAYSLFAVDGGIMTISGNVFINGSSQLAFFENNVTPATINIGKSLIVNSSVQAQVNLKNAGSSFLDNLQFTGNGTINVGATETIDSTGDGSDPGAANYTISGNYVLAEDWYLSGTASGGADTFTVSGTLDCGAYHILENAIPGAGVNPFTLNPGATLGSGEGGGLDSSGATGSIQVAGTITFSPAANYFYDGTAPQVSGPGLPATVDSLTINNAAGVTLSQATAVSGALNILNGPLTPSGTSDTALALTFDGSTRQAAGTWGSTSSTATHQDNTHFAGTGYVTISGGPSGPGYLTNQISGTSLTLTWPSGQGWRLVGQTNSLSVGLTPNGWSTVSGPGVNDGSATFTIDPTRPTVFYRLVSP